MNHEGRVTSNKGEKITNEITRDQVDEQINRKLQMRGKIN